MEPKSADLVAVCVEKSHQHRVYFKWVGQQVDEQVEEQIGVCVAQLRNLCSVDEFVEEEYPGIPQPVEESSWQPSWSVYGLHKALALALVRYTS